MDRVMKKQPILTFENGGFERTEDLVAEESAVTVHVNGEEFATMVCTPVHVEEMVTGFLASEGLIRLPADIDDLSVDSGKGFAYVTLKNRKISSADFGTKRVIGSCCGKSRQFYFHNDMKTAKTVTSKLTITPEQCIGLMKEMQAGSSDFQKTGGLHNTALCSADEVLLSRTDIGRHNALDKIYGHCLMNRVPVRDKIIAFSGRISSEVLLKVSKIGCGILLSKSAPTSLAIALAEDLGITAVGFIRGNRFNVYAHPERIRQE
ncbi:formate dehydrogenase accessory sulfurtransferase FdhD [Alteribacter natronophilus]|uniref:formate dehydrogenase accessory sulfurtransferase FdhD n=1 Tax=Alteribacter natronophilus TaxID=2583810 RepID=UPI00110F1A52|nr:formate dehydrogenase accessory sulfurtransferase FdhD [Alteribacter natronophilus]TMW72070.1 formate dehydrogenase accessory sulfurtransferase FdhD [Alteribacter natronophilus]